MKNKSLTQWILIGIICVICAAIVGTGIHLAVVLTGIHAGSGAVDMSAYDIVFSGNINLLGEDYDVTLMGKDGSFTVDAGTIQNVVEGSYTFTEGQGWTFVFADTLTTNVRSQYDANAGQHSFVYTLNLGSRGEGNLQLICKDKQFVPASQPWDDIPAFSGTGAWFGGVVTAPIVCSCNADGQFTIFGTGGEINVICGSYTQSGNDYTFTTESGEVYHSVVDAESGLPSITVSIHRPELEVYHAADTEVVLTRTVLTVD